MPESETLQALVDGLDDKGSGPAILEFHKDEVDEWSWEELAGHVRSLARGLLGDGLEPGTRVGLFAANSAPWIAAALAVVRAGGVVVPLDVQLDSDNLRHEIEDSGLARLFTDARRRERIDELDLEEAPALHLLDRAEGEESWATLEEQGGDGDLPDLDPDQEAALFYTSGTTGLPKGVPLTHRNLAFQFQAIHDAGVVGRDDRVLLPLPLHHVYPFVVGMLMPLALGVPIVLPAGITGPQVTRALKEAGATLVVGVPRLYRALVDGIRARARSGGRVAGALFDAILALTTAARRRLGLKLGRHLLKPLHRRIGPNLRLAACGGSPLAPELAYTLEGLGWDVAVGYGLTETSPLLTLKLPGQSRLDSVGRAIQGVELSLDEDVEGGGDGVGEILARGPNVFAGYHGLPDETGEALTDDDWFRTEDLGRFDDDGNLYVLGRTSTLIVTESGKNIQPDELEEAYAEDDAIDEVAILQKDNQLVALAVPAGGGDPEGAADRVREAIDRRARKLASYKRVSDVAVTREALPRTRLGKIRRGELEERFAQAKEEGDGEEARGPMDIDDMSGDDRALLDEPAARHVWDWLADKYPEQHLTPDTSPEMDLGIDSMEWVNLTLDLGEELGVDLDEEAIGRIETVRDLLVEVNEARQGEGGQMDLADAPEEQLSEAQRRWLEPLSPTADALAHGVYHLDRWLMVGLFRLRVEGAGRVPEDGNFLLAPSHGSFLDPFAVGAALPWAILRRLYWGGWTGAAFSNPLKRGFSRLARAVPIDPEKGVISSLAFGAAVLKQGNGLVWFPEGERSASGELQDFRQGIGLLLESFPVTVVPAAIHGAHEAMPPGRALPRPGGPIHVVFGEPVSTDTLADEGEGDERRQRIVDALHKRMAKLLEESSPGR